VNGIVIRNNENIEKALKRFRNVVEKAGIVYDIKKYTHFTKPSAKKREALIAARRKALMDKPKE